MLNKITIYPNPVNDRFFVDIPQSNNDELIIYINDMYGKQISSFITTQSIDINTSQCSRGIYFLRIINPKNNQTINCKLMLE